MQNIIDSLRLEAPHKPLIVRRSAVDYSPEAVEQRKRQAADETGRHALARSEWPELNALPELKRTIPERFPFDALGPVLGLAALAISNEVQAPDSLAAGSVLAAASLAAMPHADVLLPHGQRTPLSLFIITAAESGDRKSATDSIALAEVDCLRKEQARRYLLERQSNERTTAQSLTISKATTEGLQMMLKSQSAVGLFTSEGGELLSGHSMREERRSAGLAWLLKAWGAETLDALTRADGFSILLGRRVALHALIQPVLLRQLLADPLARGQGLLARCLISQPDTLAGTRLFKDCEPASNPDVVRFGEEIAALLRKKPVTEPNGDGFELTPRSLGLDAEARELWIEFHDEIEKRQAYGQDLEHARAWASKAAEHAARIAGVVQMFSDPSAASIGLDAMDGGMQVAAYYLGEHVRLTGAGRDESRTALLRALFEWIRARGKATHTDVLQKTPNTIRTLKANGINPLLTELTERGYVRRIGDAWEGRDVD